MTQKADKLDRVAKKTKHKAEVLDRIGEGLGTFDLWTRTEPSPRKPRFTRDDITAAAVRIADTEGFDALSMRRLATELDAGTMTLYHYVRTKDELLTLAVDEVMCEVVLGPDDSDAHALARGAGDARRALAARRSCATRGSST